MDDTSLYTNIPQEEGVTTVCKAYKDFYQNHLPIPTKFLRQMLCLILKENSFQFNRRHYLQTHGTAMGTKMAVAFANIFIAKTEKGIISKSKIKLLVWKRYIDHVREEYHKARKPNYVFRTGVGLSPHINTRKRKFQQQKYDE